MSTTVMDQLKRSLTYEQLRTIADLADSLSIAATIARAHVRYHKHEAAGRYIAEVKAAVAKLAELAGGLSL